MKYGIGLMSGTSIDGIDAALVEFCEKDDFNLKLINFINFNYSEKQKNEILELCSEKGTVDKICKMNVVIGELFASAVMELCKKSSFDINKVDFISSHGQTIYHDVNSEIKSTLQIGSGEIIAERTGVTVVNNFRMRDIAAGGEGAPLIPFFDYIMFKSEKKNIVLQNIGGIGNYTYLKAGCVENEIEGSDTGPGNMIIDGLISILTKNELTYDKNGEWAKKGNVDKKLLKKLMENPFFEKKTPKTTGRELFGIQYCQKILNDIEFTENFTKYDLIATVTSFTAYSIIYTYKTFIKGDIDEIIISGGGSYNPVLINYIKSYSKKYLKNAEVFTLEEKGMSSNAKEAIAFALLGYYTLKGKTNNVPSVTGANKKVVMGNIIFGEKRS
jgi:anhydro-N-acetylmuramic acid kinase